MAQWGDILSTGVFIIAQVFVLISIEYIMKKHLHNKMKMPLLKKISTHCIW